LFGVPSSAISAVERRLIVPRPCVQRGAISR
jgi:hypothetical protein